MLGFVSIFAKTEIHVSLKAEPLFNIGPLTVTNSMLYGVITSAFLILVMVIAAKRIKIEPRKGFVQIIEMITEFIITLLEGAFGSREKAIRFTPIFGTFFIFILFNNILGIFPWAGPALTYHGIDGAVPLFRAFTADLNGTIALSLIAILLVQYLSIKEQGGKKHLQHYFSEKPFNPINFFIGILEVFGELTRIMSLSLRLFLNTAVGEILIAVFTSLIIAHGRTPLAVIPIILFEILVAGIQAYVFAVLAATYLSLAIAHAHDEGDHTDEHHEPVKTKQVEGAAS